MSRGWGCCRVWRSPRPPRPASRSARFPVPVPYTLRSVPAYRTAPTGAELHVKYSLCQLLVGSGTLPHAWLRTERSGVAVACCTVA